MNQRTPQLPVPTEELVQSYIQQFNQSEDVVEQALSKLFGLFRTNTVHDEVLLKVVALNALYGTGILATRKVAEHIVSLKIDPGLGAGQTEVVHRIARIEIAGKNRNNYSFATKYCSWHNPIHYPIFDSFVEEMLWGYRKRDGFSSFQRQDLWQYSQLKQAIEDFRTHYGLSMFDLKDIDKFLWLAGKAIFPREWSSQP
ncbi:MAG TPA: hypothetical protein VKQ72_20665 [Aggregatilineales bacterium]|nr:hypothetical protein [Aggregatilineales bacterium]